MPPTSALPQPAGRRPAAHLVGIGGAGMKALAELLVGLGWKVTGSDSRASLTLERMREQGLRVFTGHDDACLPQVVDVVAYSPAIGPENLERSEAAKRSIPQLSLPEMLGALMADRVGIAVTGTHGKSTTSAMVATVLRRAGREPSAAFGAELCGSGRSGWAGKGELLVVEGCEYRRSFLSLRPRHAVVLNVEADHFDCYADVAAVERAFEEFTSLLPENGVLVARGDCSTAMRAVSRSSARIVTFGSAEAGDYWPGDLRQAEGGTRFRLFCRGEYLAQITLRIPGLHNVTNAVAAAAMCHELGVSPHDLREGLWDFRGVKRRFESVGSWRGRLLIDDYAHHPTAVRAVIEAVRREYPGRKVWCAFQPHQISRTVALLPEFVRALALADGVLVVPIYAARETAINGGPAETNAHVAEAVASNLARAITATGTSARFLPSLDLLAEAVDHDTRPGDVVMTMGAGDIDRVHHEFSRRLRRDHAVG
ncbi:MAG: UDP-N-acetylmuramate--L-alanine ligase [Planctomycetota bacterium]|nr:UDP-N-acetylmuramate--L-alanine ligase [Planctomycetota bacterium]